MFKSQIQKTIAKILKQMFEFELEAESIHIEHPADESYGDWATNVSLILTKQLGMTPREIAEQLVAGLEADDELGGAIEQVSIAGPGFINFTLKQEMLKVQLAGILNDADTYGSQQKAERPKVVVEYSSPNIAKPFTIGHLRSTIIGDAVANILEFTGNQVFRDNHLGDWGTQFGKQIYAIKEWGNEEDMAAAENPVKYLVELYVRFNEEAANKPEMEDEARAWFKKLESGDEEARELWQKCIELSFVEFNKIYERLNVSFTENDGRGYGEAFFEDKMQAVIDELSRHDFFQESDGAKLVFFPDKEFPPLMIVKKDGATLYATRDLATDKFRLEKYGRDVRIINEVGSEQTLQFQQLFRVEELLGWVKPGQRVHVKHGLYRFKDRKMSTRKGDVIWLGDILDDAHARVAEIVEQSNNSLSPVDIDAIAIGAIKWNDLKRSAHLDINFEWEDVLNLEGNSGPYMQYTYARCQSILRKASGANLGLTIEEMNIDELAVARWLLRFPEVVEAAALNYAPHLISTYLFELGQRYNAFYNKHSVLDADSDDERNFRLALTAATAQVVKTGLGLLGISVVERM